MDAKDKAIQGFQQDQKGKAVDRHTELEADQAENPQQKETARKIKDGLEPPPKPQQKR